MMKLKFKVTGRTAVRLTYDDTVVEGSQNDLYCEFAFEGEDFADKTKIANFVYGDMVIPQLIGDGGLCAVPPEVIKPPGFTMTLTIGSLITVKPVLVQVTDNGLPDGVYPPVVTLDLYSQMIGAFEDKYGAAKAEADRAETQAGIACAAADRAEQAGGGGGINSGAFLELLEAVGLRGASVFPVLDGWEFSKANAAETETVSLPHTCNADDGKSAAMYFGETVYERNISLAKQDLQGNLYLLVEYAGQKCDVYVNGNLAASHAGGYTPFTVRLNPYAVPDSNRLRIVCGNTLDFDIIPVSGDFNRCNGLYGGVYIAKCGAISFTPDGYGPDRIKLTQVSAGAERADLRIQGHILGVRGAETECGLAVTVSGPDGEKVRETVRCTVPPEGLDFDRTVSVLSPVLWQGVENPHLYTAAVSIEQSGAVLDRAECKTGFRTFQLDAEKGFLLNGMEYPLRGFAMHQDGPGTAIARTAEQIDQDLEAVMDCGCNFLRLAHYPHSGYMLRRCDELGIIVQTEIPWVNHCGTKASDAYFANIRTAMQEMIQKTQNHPSVVFLGMSNELNGSHLPSGTADQQGAFDYPLALSKSRELYSYAKGLAPDRLIGLSTHDNTFLGQTAKIKEWSFTDWIGTNQYKGWYGGKFDDFGNKLDSYRSGCPCLAVTEYGAGANPQTHSDNPMDTTNTGSGGARHDEEYQNLFHESYLKQIAARPWLVFTSAWALFDFAVAARKEGGINYQNDKGLITYDRQTKKDAYYLYRAYFGGASPTVYITSRRFAERTTENIVIKAYSDCESLKLYRDNVLIQTLAAPKETVVWEFDPAAFTEPSHEFRVAGIKNGIEYADAVTFSTTAVEPAEKIPAAGFRVTPVILLGGERGDTMDLNTAYTPENANEGTGISWTADSADVSVSAYSDHKTPCRVVLANTGAEPKKAVLTGTLAADPAVTAQVSVGVNTPLCSLVTSGSNAEAPSVIRDSSPFGNDAEPLGFAWTETSGYNRYGVLRTSGAEALKISTLQVPKNQPYTIHLLLAGIRADQYKTNQRLLSMFDDRVHIRVATTENITSYHIQWYTKGELHYETIELPSRLNPENENFDALDVKMKVDGPAAVVTMYLLNLDGDTVTHQGEPRSLTISGSDDDMTGPLSGLCFLNREDTTRGFATSVKKIEIL